MIRTINLNKNYGTKRVLKNVNLQFEMGKIYGVLGRNGAGKTTLVNVITNRAFATSGTVEIDGQNAYENDFAQQKVFCITEKNAYPSTETITNLFKWASRFYVNFDIDYAFELAKKFDLEVGKRLGKLSTGYTTIAKVILTMASGTPYMIFDEPVLGIDAIYREVFYEELLLLHKKLGNCMILATHILDEAERVVDDVIVLREGVVAHNSTLKQITATQSVQEFYLQLHKTPLIEDACRAKSTESTESESTESNESKSTKSTESTESESTESTKSESTELVNKADLLKDKKIKLNLNRFGIDGKKIKNSIRYLMYITWLQAVIVAALCVIFTVIPLLNSKVEMSIEVTVLINMMILAMAVHGTYYKYALYNGVSRKTYSTSLGLVLLVYALVFAILTSTTILIQSATNYDSVIFMAFYPIEFGFGAVVSTLCWMFSSIIFVMSLGLLSVVIYQILSRKGKYVAMAVLMLITIILIVWSSLASFSRSPLRVLLFFLGQDTHMSGVWFSSLWGVVFGGILGFISWMILKRIEVK